METRTWTSGPNPHANWKQARKLQALTVSSPEVLLGLHSPNCLSMSKRIPNDMRFVRYRGVLRWGQLKLANPIGKAEKGYRKEQPLAIENRPQRLLLRKRRDRS